MRVAAAYELMTAVAGDFYESLRVDEYRAGFLVADVMACPPLSSQASPTIQQN